MENNDFQRKNFQNTAEFLRRDNDPSNVMNGYYRIPAHPVKPPEVYDAKDRLFGFTAIVLGFVMLKVILNSRYSGGGFLSFVLFLGIAIFNYQYCNKMGMKGTRETKAVFVICVMLSSSFLITDNYYVKTIDFWILLLSNLYFVYASYSSNRNSIISNLFNAVLISPFLSSEVFSAQYFTKLRRRMATGKA